MKACGFVVVLISHNILFIYLAKSILNVTVAKHVIQTSNSNTTRSQGSTDFRGPYLDVSN